MSLELEKKELPKSELHLFPTYHCNFTCKFCYQAEYKNSKVMDLKKLPEVLENIKKEKQCEFSRVTLMGGELATLSDKYLDELMTIVESLNVPIQIFTNLWKIKKRLLDHAVFVSWDFDAREHHDEILANMLSLDRKFDTSTVVSKKLLNMSMDEIVSFYSSIKNLDRAYFSFFKYNKFNGQMGTTFDQYLDFLERLQAYPKDFTVYQFSKPILSDKHFLRVDPYLNVNQNVGFYEKEKLLTPACKACPQLPYCEYYTLIKSQDSSTCRYRKILENV